MGIRREERQETKEFEENRNLDVRKLVRSKRKVFKFDRPSVM